MSVDAIAGEKPLVNGAATEASSPQRSITKSVVLFDWPPSSYTGWGVYGLNLMMNWAKRSDFSICCAQPINNDHLAINPLERRVIHRVLEDSRAAFASFAGLRGKVRASCAVLHPLGNNLSVARRSRSIIGTPSIGITFFEETQFDKTVRDRAGTYPLIIAGSTWNRDALAEVGIDHVKIVIQGIDTTHFHPGPRMGLFTGHFVVFSGGKLERRKGQDLVLQAFRVFAERHPDALLVTAWNSPWPQLARTLEANTGIAPITYDRNNHVDVPAWAHANGISERNIIDIGRIPNAEMPRILREVDVALFPNRAEGGTNLVAMECMACGVPTILSANTGHLDLIRDDNCYALKRQHAISSSRYRGWGESDVDEILEALEGVYQRRADAVQRGCRGAEIMANLTWPRQLDQLASLIKPYLI